MSGDGKSVRTLFRAKLDWSWGPDAGPRLISSGLPADHDHLMRPHPQAATTRRSMRALAARISRKMRVIGLRFVRNGQSESLITDHAEPLSRSSTTLSLGEKDPMEVDSLGRPLAGRTTRGQVSLPREEGGGLCRWRRFDVSFPPLLACGRAVVDWQREPCSQASPLVSSGLDNPFRIGLARGR